MLEKLLDICEKYPKKEKTREIVASMIIDCLKIDKEFHKFIRTLFKKFLSQEEMIDEIVGHVIEKKLRSEQWIMKKLMI
jgi:uncharacterized protein YnzC (UPF0291/DUF896 family)